MGYYVLAQESSPNIQYFLFMDKYVARSLNMTDPKIKTHWRPYEWWIDGKWQDSKELSTHLQDAMMDYGNYSVWDYDELTEEQANKFIKQ